MLHPNIDWRWTNDDKLLFLKRKNLSQEGNLNKQHYSNTESWHQNLPVEERTVKWNVAPKTIGWRCGSEFSDITLTRYGLIPSLVNTRFWNEERISHHLKRSVKSGKRCNQTQITHQFLDVLYVQLCILQMFTNSFWISFSDIPDCELQWQKKKSSTAEKKLARKWHGIGICGWTV